VLDEEGNFIQRTNIRDFRQFEEVCVMGNSSKIHIAKLYISLLLAAVSFLIAACEVPQPEVPELADILPQPQNNQEPPGQGGVPLPNGEERISANIHCPDVRRDECGLMVTVNPVSEDVELDIKVYRDYGVRFLPNLDVIPEAGGVGAIQRVRLLTGESRDIYFPYQPDNLELPGAFKVNVVATHTGSSVLYDEDVTNAFFWLDDVGEFHLLSSLEAYRDQYESMFVDGDPELDLGYSIVMEEGARPYRGHLWVRVDSTKDNYWPIIEIKSTGALTFLDDNIWNPQISEMGMKATKFFPMIQDGGTRVARFPFELDRTGRLLNGTYVFMVTLSELNIPDSERHERMPVAIELHSDPQYPNEHWLSPTAVPYEIATSTPIGGAGAGGVNEDVLNPENIDANKVCEQLANVRFKNNIVNEIHWTKQISNYNGTLCEAYLEFVAFNIPLSWNDFQRIMLLANENLTSEDSNLKAAEVYIVPELDQ
jgi:hypothetical protein